MAMQLQTKMQRATNNAKREKSMAATLTATAPARRGRHPPGGVVGISDVACQQISRVFQDLHRAVAERDRAMQTAWFESRQTQRHLVMIAAGKYGESVEHCLRVGAIAACIAYEMGQPTSWCDMLFEAAPLHDIGAPDASHGTLLSFATPERSQFEKHTLHGAKLLGNWTSPSLKLAADIALNHHERWDGSGYPAGRCAEDIPLGARITAVADFIDCVSRPASGAPGLAEQEIRNLIELASGAQFDPAVADATQRILSKLGRINDLAEVYARQIGSPALSPLWWRHLA